MLGVGCAGVAPVGARLSEQEGPGLPVQSWCAWQYAHEAAVCRRPGRGSTHPLRPPPPAPHAPHARTREHTHEAPLPLACSTCGSKLLPGTPRVCRAWESRTRGGARRRAPALSSTAETVTVASEESCLVTCWSRLGRASPVPTAAPAPPAAAICRYSSARRVSSRPTEAASGQAGARDARMVSSVFVSERACLVQSSPLCSHQTGCGAGSQPGCSPRAPGE